MRYIYYSLQIFTTCQLDLCKSVKSVKSVTFCNILIVLYYNITGAGQVAGWVAWLYISYSYKISPIECQPDRSGVNRNKKSPVGL